MELFLVCSSLLQLAMACSVSLHFLQATTSQNVFTCQFIINQLLQRSARAIKKRYSFLNYKEGQVVLQIRAGTTKWGKVYYKGGQ